MPHDFVWITIIPMAVKDLFGIAAVVALVCCVALSAQSGSKDAAKSGSNEKAKIERGRYLVEEVGKCQDCHTPRLPTGDYDRSKWLKGAPIDFKPIHPMPKWEEHAPDLTRSGLLKEWGETGLAKFLETGKGPYDNMADPPMPTYKLKHEDAAAIAAYLASLK